MTVRAGQSLAGSLSGRGVVVCLGAGGVGKTTTSAALALGLAMRGQKVAVVTIDPARRLASALGLEALSGRPRRIDIPLTAHPEGRRQADAPAAGGTEVHGTPDGGGELWAMMLDAKRTFDEVVEQLAPDAAAREEILANPVYRELSNAVAGSQELSAVAKLYELYEEHDFDVIVLDTPPSRNALDFLDTPGRLLAFLDGRALQVFLAPGGVTARLFGRGTALVFSIFARVTGVNMLGELSRFFRSLSGVIDGFAERTRGVARLLRSPATAYLIVTSPEADPCTEAAFLARRLAERGMPQARLVVNRVHSDGLEGSSAAAVQEQLAAHMDGGLARRAARNLADFDVLARRDAAAIGTLAERVGSEAPVLIPQLAEEIKDLFGLVRVAERLLG